MENLIQQLRAIFGGPLMDAAKQVVVLSEASAPPYDPAYGLADSTRERAVRIAREKGVQSAIAECNVSQASVYRWLKAYESSASNT